MRLVHPAVAVGTNMRGFQSRQCALLRDGAPPSVDICNKHPKRSLSESGANEVRLAKARAELNRNRGVRSAQPNVDRFPKGPAVAFARTVSLERDDVR